MSVAAQPPRDTDDDQRRELIGQLVPAAQRLLESGLRYPDITVSRLVAEAGISRWRFYSRFRDKHELLHAWFQELNVTFAQNHHAWLDLDHRPTLDELRQAVGDLFIPYGPHSTLHAALYDSAAADPVIRAELESTENERIEDLREHIERGQAEGWIDKSLLALETAEWIILTGSRAYQRMVVTSRELSSEEFVATFSHFVWRVLYARA